VPADFAKLAFVTICARNYLSMADVLMQSVKAHMPEALRICCIIDDPAGASQCDSFDKVLPASDLHLNNFDRFIFGFDIAEAATAIKPKLLMHTLRSHQDIETVVFLDPDILVVSPFLEFGEALAGDRWASVTPHHLHDETDGRMVRKNMLRTLRCGVYNLGFLAIRRCAATSEFLRWWHHKLAEFGLVDFDRGLFVDQKWMDIAVGLFPGIGTLRHTGYNIANWNVARRCIQRERPGGAITTGDGEPARFLHFSSISSGKDIWILNGQIESDHLYFALRSEYRDRLKMSRFWDLRYCPWRYGSFASGETIIPAARAAYRNNLRLRENYPQPFEQSNETFISCGY
jgi:hypothetical protein